MHRTRFMLTPEQDKTPTKTTMFIEWRDRKLFPLEIYILFNSRAKMLNQYNIYIELPIHSQMVHRKLMKKKHLRKCLIYNLIAFYITRIQYMYK